MLAIGFLHDVRAATAGAALQVRCGVEVGRVALDDGDVIGPAVYVATELCKRAAPDQILGSATVAGLAGASTAGRVGPSTLRATGTEIEVVSL